MRKFTFIYSLSDPISGQVRYIGKSDRIDKRLNEHIRESYKKKNYRDKWINSLISKGAHPVLEILDEVESNQWQYWEKYWISQFKIWGFKLVNSTDGGEGNNNQIFTLETRKKLSEKFSGEGNPFFNKKHSDETKKILKHKRQFQKTNFSKLLESNKNKRKPVIQYDKYGNIIKEWEYVLEAATKLGLIASHISSVCNKKRKSCGGYIWKFKNKIDEKI